MSYALVDVTLATGKLVEVGIKDRLAKAPVTVFDIEELESQRLQLPVAAQVLRNPWIIQLKQRFLAYVKVHGAL